MSGYTRVERQVPTTQKLQHDVNDPECETRPLLVFQRADLEEYTSSPRTVRSEQVKADATEWLMEMYETAELRERDRDE